MCNVGNLDDQDNGKERIVYETVTDSDTSTRTPQQNNVDWSISVGSETARTTGNSTLRSKRKQKSGSLPEHGHITSNAPQVTNNPHKKSRHIEDITEERRFFKGSRIYFLPNNKISIPRKLRIEKFEQYGGEWLKTWSNNAKVIVLENNLTYSDVLRYLKIQKLADDVVVADERYISDCIERKTLLEPQLERYHVDGDPKTIHLSTSQDLKPKRDNKFIDQVAQKTPSPHYETDVSEPMSSEHITSEKQVSVTNTHLAEMMTSEELSTLMEEARRVNSLLVDDSDDSSEDNDKSNNKLKASKIVKYQNQFLCMREGNSIIDQKNPNCTTIQILGEMAKHYELMSDDFRARSYRVAVSILKKQTTKISTKEAARNLRGIGESIAEKIEEINLTSGLRKLNNIKNDATDSALKLFMGIYGVGLRQANQWLLAGHRTLDDISTKTSLSHNQKIGLERYDDFQQRIPRDEVSKHAAVVQKVLKSIDLDMSVTIGGSYRRGAMYSSDIDLIITKFGADNSELAIKVFDQAIPKLFERNFLVAALTNGKSNTKITSKWHGASVLHDSKIWRRLDILLVPWNQRGAAMIYFTGNDIFNRSLRLLARKKGMRLNQMGLYRDVCGAMEDAKKKTTGELLESESERRIFSILGVPWREPEDRSV